MGNEIYKVICQNIFVVFFIFIFFIIIILSTHILVNDFFSYKGNEQLTKEIIESVIIEDIETNEILIDWNNLKSINKDIIGWIEIEDTKINYPILQDNSNLYYINHSYNRKYNANGSIFTININPFVESETIIYGHNMKGDSMFSSLGKYFNKDFLYNHQNFKIYTPDATYKATIFSVYSIGIDEENRNIKGLNYNDKINYYKNASKYNLEIDSPIDNIIKLSTCSYINAKTIPTDQRCYIIAKIENVN